MGKILDSIQKGLVKQRRKSLAKRAFAKYDGVVQFGAFKGMTFAGVANISQSAHGLKIYGLYESLVMDTLLGWCPCQNFVDIGAGDGYFPVGLSLAGKVQRAIGFEATSKGREAIMRNAELNGVSDKVEVYEKAGPKFDEQFAELGLDPKSTVVLCDIEGGEFSILTKELLQRLDGARFVVELHDRLMEDGYPKLRESLLNAFPATYSTRIVVDTPRSWNGVEELERMSDLDRALLLSEGRKIIGEWLIAEPAV